MTIYRTSLSAPVWRWVCGLVVGTLLVWATSPWFVRSYHSRVYDSVYGDWVYPSGTAYRWRSEGYATTVFGPHGMPGRTTLPTQPGPHVVALWGDSQAEGVCVDDEEKLAARLQARLHRELNLSVAVLPMAHSGDDARDWVERFLAAESELSVDEHVMLVCELEDLQTLAEIFQPREGGLVAVDQDSAWLNLVPDFLIHAGRGVLLDSTGMSLRRLRFGLGPAQVAPPRDGAFHDSLPSLDPLISWNTVARRLAESTRKPITVIYAPRLPVVMGGQVFREDPVAVEFHSLARSLDRLGIRVVDCRDALQSAFDRGRFPHGFHNGVFGNGHLNAEGYRVIADVVAIQAATQQSNAQQSTGQQSTGQQSTGH